MICIRIVLAYAFMQCPASVYASPSNDYQTASRASEETPAIPETLDDAHALLQSKTKVTKLQAEAPGDGHAESLLQSLQGMLHAAPDRNMSELPMIKGIVRDTLLPGLVSAHEFGQKEIDSSKGRIDSCNSEATNGMESVANFEGAMQQAETSHETCRSEEAVKASDESAKCGALDAFVVNTAFPTVPASRALPAMRVVFGQYKTLAFDFDGKDLSCNTSDEVHAEQVKACNENQTTFENHFCEYRLELSSVAATKTECYDSSKTAHEKLVQEMQGKVSKWKAEYMAIQKILCYLDIWLGDGNLNTVRADMASSCETSSVDTSAMDIVYPVVPPAKAIDVSPIQEYPGTDGWRERYDQLHVNLSGNTVWCSSDVLQLPVPPTSTNESTNATPVSCPVIAHGSCSVCRTESTCFASTCDPNWFDDNLDSQDGCELGCPSVTGGNCTKCSDVNMCTEVSCGPNSFDVNQDATDGCEAGCPETLIGAICVECSSPVACTKLTCLANHFDVNGDVSDGCEVTCPLVHDGSCTTCSSPTECTVVKCDSGRFDVNGDANDGCEVGCPNVTDGICLSCSGPSVCSEVVCDSNRFDVNGDASDGCEIGCPSIPKGICAACSDPWTCSSLSTCEEMARDTNGIANDGCEDGCPKVTHGTCKTCSQTACTSVLCNANNFDLNGDASDGCEAGCPVVEGGTCTACSDSSTCTNVTCHPEKLDDNGDATDGCEAGCPPVTCGTCTKCSLSLGLLEFEQSSPIGSPMSTCTEVSCDAGFVDHDGKPSNGCANSSAVCLSPSGPTGDSAADCNKADGHRMVPPVLACSQGYHLSGHVCLENQCKCVGGTAAKGAQCGGHGSNKCVSCQDEAVLENGVCVVPRVCPVPKESNTPKSCEIPKSCEEAKECEVAKTCDVAKSCNVAKRCSIDATCDVAATCDIAKSCAQPKSCNLPKTCSVPKSCSVTRTCSFNVANSCDAFPSCSCGWSGCSCSWTWVTSAAECGWKTITQTNAAQCGYETITNAGRCGWQSVTSGASCGYTWTEKAWECGSQTVTDAVACGTQQVTDAAHCGWKAVTDAASCGTEAVTDAAKCGTEFVADAAKCGTQAVEDAVKCGTKLVKDAVECGTKWVTCGVEAVVDAAKCGSSFLFDDSYSDTAPELKADVDRCGSLIPCSKNSDCPGFLLWCGKLGFCEVLGASQIVEFIKGEVSPDKFPIMEDSVSGGPAEANYRVEVVGVDDLELDMHVDLEGHMPPESVTVRLDVFSLVITAKAKAEAGLEAGVVGVDLGAKDSITSVVKVNLGGSHAQATASLSLDTTEHLGLDLGLKIESCDASVVANPSFSGLGVFDHVFEKVSQALLVAFKEELDAKVAAALCDALKEKTQDLDDSVFKSIRSFELKKLFDLFDLDFDSLLSAAELGNFFAQSTKLLDIKSLDASKLKDMSIDDVGDLFDGAGESLDSMYKSVFNTGLTSSIIDTSVFNTGKLGQFMDDLFSAGAHRAPCIYDQNKSLPPASYLSQGLDLANQALGAPFVGFPAAQKKQLHGALELRGKSDDGSIDVFSVMNGIFEWWLEYNQSVDFGSDTWGSNVKKGNGEYRYQEGKKGGRSVGDFHFVEPCNTVSNAAYFEAVAYVACEDYRFSKDEWASLLLGFAGQAAGSYFYHGAQTHLGHKLDWKLIELMTYQAYQLVVGTLVEKSSDKLSMQEQHALLYLGEPGNPMATDVAKSWSALFQVDYEHNYTRLMDAIGNVQAPSYFRSVSAIVLVVLRLLSDAFTDWIPSGVRQFLPKGWWDRVEKWLLELTSDSPWLEETYLPALQKAIRGLKICSNFQIRILTSMLKFAITFGDSFIHQEDYVPVKGDPGMPVSVAEVLHFFEIDMTGSFAPMPHEWDYYNGHAAYCHKDRDHSEWHEKSAQGLLHLVKLANDMDKICEADDVSESIDNPTELPEDWSEAACRTGEFVLSGDYRSGIIQIGLYGDRVTFHQTKGKWIAFFLGTNDDLAQQMSNVACCPDPKGQLCGAKPAADDAISKKDPSHPTQFDYCVGISRGSWVATSFHDSGQCKKLLLGAAPTKDKMASKKTDAHIFGRIDDVTFNLDCPGLPLFGKADDYSKPGTTVLQAPFPQGCASNPHDLDCYAEQLLRMYGSSCDTNEERQGSLNEAASYIGEGQLKVCEGGCAVDKDCFEGLKCYQREVGEPMPHCWGTPKGDTNYCYEATGAQALATTGKKDSIVKTIGHKKAPHASKPGSMLLNSGNNKNDKKGSAALDKAMDAGMDPAKKKKKPGNIKKFFKKKKIVLKSRRNGK